MTNGTLQTVDPFNDYTRKPEDVRGASSYLDLLSGMYRAGDLLPIWYSPKRDMELRKYVKKSDQLSSAVYTMVSKLVSIPRKARALNKNNVSSVKRIEQQWKNIETYSQNMEGLAAALRLFLHDYYTQDNGAFMAILAPGDLTKAPEGLPIAVKHLDSSRCVRTGELDYPVIYRPSKGIYKGKHIPLHRARVFSMSSMASPDEEMHGVGFCAISRAVNAAQTLIDLYRYKNEKMGSRPNRQILFGSGMEMTALQNHLVAAAKASLASSNRIYSATIPIAEPNPQADLKLIDMVATPDFFDEKVSVTLAMYAISFAFGVDARTFFPASETGATKADATIQHLKAMGQGIGDVLSQLEHLFELYILPDDAELLHDYVDDEQDRNQAEIRGLRAENRSTDLQNEVITMRVAREQMLDTGDLTPEEFEELELDDGRLADGTPVSLLFFSDDSTYSLISNNPFDDILDTDFNDADAIMDWIVETRRTIRPLIVNAQRYDRKVEAQRMLAALAALEGLYTDDNSEAQMQEEIDTGQEGLPPEPMPAQPPRTPPTPEPPSEEGEMETRQLIPFDAKTINQYRQGIRAAMLGLYRGDFTRTQFYSSMRSSIARRIKEAFLKGAKECGILESDLTKTEKDKINEFVRNEREYLPGLADAVISARDNDRKFNTLDYRIDMWVNRYNEVFATAQTMVCGDVKLKWIRSMNKDSCPDCKMLDGKVYRASTWDEMGIRPQSNLLACGGFRCGCSFEQTDEAVTRGRRPRLSKEFVHEHSVA